MERGSALLIFLLFSGCAVDNVKVVPDDAKDSINPLNPDGIDRTSSDLKGSDNKPAIRKYGTLINDVPDDDKRHEDVSAVKNIDSKIEDTNPNSDAYIALFESLRLKDYLGAEKIIKQLNFIDEDMQYIYMLILDKLGEHELPVKYWEELVKNYNKSRGIRITDIEFCTKITGYGRFDVADSNEFVPGSSLLVYIGMKYFSLNNSSNGKSNLRIKYNWELYDTNGNKLPLWENVPDDIRTDNIFFTKEAEEYYQSFLLPLPKNISGGDYKLKVRVKDMLTGTETEQEKELKILFVN